jgi:hypothetical protein
LTAIQATVVESMWRETGHVVESVLDPAGRVVAAGLATESSLPLFGPLARLPEPGRGAACLLRHRLTSLRYLRSDIHTCVLRDAGLALPEAHIIDLLWRGATIAPSQSGWVAALVGKGWVAPSDPPVLSGDGQVRRSGIEEETNRRIQAVMDLVAAEDVRALVDGLPQFPG